MLVKLLPIAFTSLYATAVVFILAAICAVVPTAASHPDAWTYFWISGASLVGAVALTTTYAVNS